MGVGLGVILLVLAVIFLFRAVSWRNASNASRVASRLGLRLGSLTSSNSAATTFVRHVNALMDRTLGPKPSPQEVDRFADALGQALGGSLRRETRCLCCAVAVIADMGVLASPELSARVGALLATGGAGSRSGLIQMELPDAPARLEGASQRG